MITPPLRRVGLIGVKVPSGSAPVRGPSGPPFPPSGMRQDAVPLAPSLLASPLVDRRRVGSGMRMKVRLVLDVIFVLLTLGVFGLLALAVRGMERL